MNLFTAERPHANIDSAGSTVSGTRSSPNDPHCSIRRQSHKGERFLKPSSAKSSPAVCTDLRAAQTGAVSKEYLSLVRCERSLHGETEGLTGQTRLSAWTLKTDLGGSDSGRREHTRCTASRVSAGRVSAGIRHARHAAPRPAPDAIHRPTMSMCKNKQIYSVNLRTAHHQ